MKTTTPVSLTRLRELLDTYGADPGRWPADERMAAEALLADSPEARNWREAARSLDAILDAAPAPRPSVGLLDSILGAADALPGQAPAPVIPLTSARHRALRRWLRPAAWVPLAAAATLILWLQMRPADAPQLASLSNLDTALYDNPTDVLLDAPGIEELDALPSFGCVDDGLGCIETDSQTRSALTLERQA